jgi:hypothetical protein
MMMPTAEAHPRSEIRGVEACAAMGWSEASALELKAAEAVGMGWELG